MSEPKFSIGDVLGIKPVGEALVVVTKATTGAAAKFYDHLCKPAVKEAGLYFRDIISEYRQRNLLAMKIRVEQKLSENKVPDGHGVHPRLMHVVLDESSWVDDAVVQDMWAGLLSSSCTEGGDDDSNLLFTTILADLTKLQTRILKHACEKAKKISTLGGLIHTEDLVVELAELIEVSGVQDTDRLDRELDSLREQGLLSDGGFPAEQPLRDVQLTPSPLALHLYVRAAGSRVSPVDYFGVRSKSADTPPPDASPS